MKRYIIYGRVSTVWQDASAQLLANKNWITTDCEQPEIIEYAESISAYKKAPEERPVLQEMLAMLKKGDTVVVYSLDRLGRVGDELISVYKQIRKKCKVHSICQPGIKPSMIYVFAFMSEEEREMISVRTKNTLTEKKSKHERAGAIPYGWQLDPSELQLSRPRAPSFGKPYRLIPEPLETSVIQLCLSLRKAGNSIYKIANHLDDLGYKNRAGKSFHPMSVDRILKKLEDPMYRDQLRVG